MQPKHTVGGFCVISCVIPETAGRGRTPEQRRKNAGCPHWRGGAAEDTGSARRCPAAAERPAAVFPPRNPAHRLFRHDGYPQPAGYQILDGFLIVHPGGDPQLAFPQAHLGQKAVGAFLAAAARLPQNDGFGQQLGQGGLPLGLKRQKPAAHRGDQHHPVPKKGLAADGFVLAGHAAHAHVEQPLRHPLNHLAAVALVHHEITARVLFAVAGQHLRQDAGRGDGGSPQLDDVLVALPPALQQVILQFQHPAGAFVQLLPPGRDLQILGVPQKELGVQLLLQRPDVGADGGLGKTGVLRRPGEAAIAHHRREGAQLLKLHEQSPPARPGPRPRPLRC